MSERRLDKLEAPRPPDWDPMSYPTPEQLWSWYGAMPPAEQLEMCARFIENMAAASRCFQADHESAVEQVRCLQRLLAAHQPDDQDDHEDGADADVHGSGRPDGRDQGDQDPEGQAEGGQVDGSTTAAESDADGGEQEADERQEQQEDVESVHGDSFVDTSAAFIADRIFPTQPSPSGLG